MEHEKVIALIRENPGLSKAALFALLDKAGDTRTRSAQYWQMREILRTGKVEDRGQGVKTSLFATEAKEPAPLNDTANTPPAPDTGAPVHVERGSGNPDDWEAIRAITREGEHLEVCLLRVFYDGSKHPHESAAAGRIIETYKAQYPGAVPTPQYLRAWRTQP